MRDGLMTAAERRRGARIRAVFIRDHAARSVGVLCKHVAETVVRHALQHAKANIAAAFDDTEHRRLVVPALRRHSNVALLAADVRLVGFNSSGQLRIVILLMAESVTDATKYE